MVAVSVSSLFLHVKRDKVKGKTEESGGGRRGKGLGFLGPRVGD
jgi:hypothetical protein